MIKVRLHLCVEELIILDLVLCWSFYNTRAVLLCGMRPHKQTRSDTISCSHTHVVFLFYLLQTKHPNLIMIPDHHIFECGLWLLASAAHVHNSTVFHFK